MVFPAVSHALRQLRLRRPVEALLATVALVLLGEAGLLADVPLWLVPGLMILGFVLSTAVTRWWGTCCSSVQLHFRIASQAIAVTAVIYATGWGPALAIGYACIAADAVEELGSTAARPVLLWSIAGIVFGQLAIALGIAPTLVSAPVAHSLALLTTLGLAYAVRVLGSAAAKQEQALQTLRESGSRFRSLVDSAHAAVIIANSAGNIVLWNPAARDLFGYEEAEVLGKPLTILMPERFKDAHCSGLY